MKARIMAAICAVCITAPALADTPEPGADATPRAADAPAPPPVAEEAPFKHWFIRAGPAEGVGDAARLAVAGELERGVDAVAGDLGLVGGGGLGMGQGAGARERGQDQQVLGAFHGGLLGAGQRGAQGWAGAAVRVISSVSPSTSTPT